MENIHEAKRTVLTQLFDAELQYRSDMDPVVSEDNRDGVLIGTGDGTVTGERIIGTIRWSLYSGNCAYVFVQAGVEPPPDQHLCTVNPGGVIETEDGAEIWFDARGYGLRGADETQPHMWTLTMALDLKTTDERYEWLNTTLGVLVSEFDEVAGHALWRAYVPEASE